MSIYLSGRREWTAIGLALLGMVSVASAQPTNEDRPAAPRRTSIILIVADNLGWGDLGCYGQTKVKTPNLDRLAAEGVRFTSYYAGSAAATASRASLLLGLHTGHLEIRGEAAGSALTSGDQTIAQVLKQSGYLTGLFGLWDLGEAGSATAPQNKGFDHFVGLLNRTEAADDYSDYLWLYDPAHYGLDNQPHVVDQKFPLGQNENGQRGTYIPNLISDMGTNFVRIYKPNRARNWQPFFLMISQTIPDVSEGRLPPPGSTYAGESWPGPEKTKAAMIASLDAGIGRVLEKLKETKQTDNTVVIFTSVHGPQKNSLVSPKFFQSTGALRGAQDVLSEGGIRVPLIVWSPALIKPGVVTVPWAAWDLFPTLEEIGRLPASTNLDGISFKTLLFEGSQTNRHEHLYWEMHGEHVQQAVRVGDWKGYRPQLGAPLELYNLKTDAGESTNVADKNPAIVTKIEKLMRSARTDSSRWPMKEEPAEKGKP